MALLGQGALLIMHDIDEGGEEDFRRWHSEEHFVERMGVPGFLRGRRYVALDAEPGFCILYEVRTARVLASEPYLRRLEEPTPWSRRLMASFRDTSRTACAVRFSSGFGVGALLLAFELSPARGAEAALERWLTGKVFADLAASKGLTALHVLAGDRAASEVATEEKRLRAAKDRLADWVLLVEGYDERALIGVAARTLPAEQLVARGAAPGSRGGLYRLEHCVSRADLVADR